MMILAALFLAQVADYRDLPQPSALTQVRCEADIRRVENFVDEYHGFVNRHEIDRGGKLTTEQGIVYRGEVDRYAREPLADLRRMKFSGDARACYDLAEDTLDGLARIIANRFASAYGYVRRDGRWQKPQRLQR